MPCSPETPPPAGDIVRYHSQFFNVVAELFPGLVDLHYGLTPPGPRVGGARGMIRRLQAGPVRLLERVTKLAGLPVIAPDARPLSGVDVGCGLGGTCRFLASRWGATMVGVNLNAAQLRLAAARLARHPAAERIQLCCAEAGALPLASESRDLAVMIEVAFHLRDKARALGEMARVLRPGGRLILVDQEGTIDADGVGETPREGSQQVMGLFWFAREGELRRLAGEAGLAVQVEADLTGEVARWMEDYVRAAAAPFHLGAALVALRRGGPGLAWRYLRGVRYFSSLVEGELRRRGVAVGWSHPLSGVGRLREHTLAELQRGNMRYKAFVFRKEAGGDG